MVPPSPSADRVLAGVVLMTAFCVVAPLIDVASKLAARSLPVGQITLARFVMQAALMAPFMLAFRLPWRIGRRTALLLAVRAAAALLSTYSFIAALAVMPLADALAIAFVEPFIILFLGRAIYGEQVGARRLGASVVGFCGALVVIQPSLAAFGPKALFPLGTALFFAVYILMTRHLSRDLHPVAMQTLTAIAASLMFAPVILFATGSGIATLDPVWPDGLAWLWLFAVGLAGSVSHMFITYALRFAPSATLAPLHYLEIVSAVALGYLVFGDWPDLATWAGIAVITAAGLYIIRRERVLSRLPLSVPQSPR